MRKPTDAELQAFLEAQRKRQTAPPPRSFDHDRARRIKESLWLRNVRLAEADPDAHPMRVERLRQRLSVRELAAKAGTSPNTVWRLELRVVKPHSATYGKLARALGVRPVDLRA